MEKLNLVHILSDLFAIGVVGILLRIVWMQLNRRLEVLEKGGSSYVTEKTCETVQKMQEERYERLDAKLSSICTDLKEMRKAFFDYLKERSHGKDT